MTDQASLSPIETLALLPRADGERIVAALDDKEMEALCWDWDWHARPKQRTPAGDWSLWIVKAGRGFGKTRTGTGWVHKRAMQFPGHWMALVAKTPADARDMMIEGPGGILDRAGNNIRPSERPIYSVSKRRVSWPNGSWATIFSDEEPDQLRGFSGLTAWFDEFAKFRNQQACWDNLQFGMREVSDDRPRRLVTTTPRPSSFLRSLEHQKGTIVTTGSSYENRANVSPEWFTDTILKYEGTTIGRQEIYAEDLDPEESGIVKRSSFRLWPHNKPLPSFAWIVVSLDTAFTEDARDKKANAADPTACTVWGAFYHNDTTYVRGSVAKDETQGPLHLMCLDAWQDHLGFPQLIDRARAEMRKQYGLVDRPLIKPLIGPALGHDEGKRPDILLIEDKGSGISLRQQLYREGIVAHPYNPGRASKLQRLHMVSHVFQQRMAWLVESEKLLGQPKSWYDQMLEQLCSYAGDGSTLHDDFVDSVTQAVRLFLDKNLVRVTPVTSQERDAELEIDIEAAVEAERDHSNPYGV